VAWREAFYIVKALAPALLPRPDAAAPPLYDPAVVQREGVSALPAIVATLGGEGVTLRFGYAPETGPDAPAPPALLTVGAGKSATLNPEAVEMIKQGMIDLSKRKTHSKLDWHESKYTYYQFILNPFDISHIFRFSIFKCIFSVLRNLALIPTSRLHGVFSSIARDMALGEMFSVADTPDDAITAVTAPPPHPRAGLPVAGPEAVTDYTAAVRAVVNAPLGAFTDTGDLQRLKEHRKFAGCSCRLRVPLCPHRDYRYDAAALHPLLPPPFGSGSAYPLASRYWLPTNRDGGGRGPLNERNEDDEEDEEDAAFDYDTSQAKSSEDEVALALAHVMGLAPGSRAYPDETGGMWCDDVKSASEGCAICELLVWDRVVRCDENSCPCFLSGVKCTAYVKHNKENKNTSMSGCLEMN